MGQTEKPLSYGPQFWGLHVSSLPNRGVFGYPEFLTHRQMLSTRILRIAPEPSVGAVSDTTGMIRDVARMIRMFSCEGGVGEPPNP